MGNCHMKQRILPIAALLLGSGFLLFAGGVNALVLPLRGTEEGFTALSLGLLGTGWAIGYILGCLFVPRLVARVGHIRSFSVMAACAGIAVLASLLIIHPAAWILLRAISGFCFAGAAMIVEGWLSERSEPSTRGTIFGVYTMVNLGATTAGQMILAAGGASGFFFFVLAAMFYMLAVIPTAVSSSQSPKPLYRVKLDIGTLYRNSPLAVVAVFMVGLSNSAFGTLSAVYATGIGLDLTTVTLFASVPILAGALVQVPVGYLSDRVDRRVVLIGVSAVALAADLVFIVAHPQDTTIALAVAAVLGATIFSMYPAIVAHANDHADPEDYVLTTGGLLLVFGLGSIIGPLIAGFLMGAIGLGGLFQTMAAAHILIIVYGVWRMTQRGAVALDDKTVFVPSAPTRTVTPQTAVFAPDVEELAAPHADDGAAPVATSDR